MANAWCGKAVIYIIIISLGNMVGGSLIPLAAKVLDKEVLPNH
jgi:formate/nitrite transporter FocA (FNT family)